jgi:DNA (cytosine-5)-methyltransferase 1
MKYISVCSGIEAATCAWEPLGWQAQAFSEIEKFPSAVLEHHYPTVPNLGDMTKFKEWENYGADVLVGGTPCQSFSIAGLRKGLDDPRGNLMLTYLAIANKYRPKWLVWENVTGVLSSNGGRDFGSLLGGLGKLGYGFAYRVLDAQYFRVAQRRRRVFVVGCLGDWRGAAAVLFERESMCRNIAPSRAPWEEIAPTIRAGAANGGKGHGARSGDSKDELIIPITFDRQSSGEYGTSPISSTDSARDYKGPSDLVAYGIQANIIGRDDKNSGNGSGFSEGIAPTLTKTDQHAVAVVHGTQDPCVSDIAFAIGRNNGGENCLIQSSTPFDCAGTMLSRSTSGGFSSSIDHAAAGYMALQKQQVRRLTPIECARLQGFPDNYLDIIFNKKLACDGPKYKALGNSMAVPCMKWIGERIQMVDDLQKSLEVVA